jgi:16S rRNA processing protein RimM
MVVMGRVRAPHGIKGWIKVQPFTQQIEGLLDFERWWLGRNGQWQHYQVAEAAVHGATVIARLEGCESREAAAGLKGAEVAIPRSELPAAGANEYYWDDLIGANVVNRVGAALGQVTGLLETGANPVLVLKADRERLIPFIAGVVVEVDVAGRRIVVDWELDY